MTIGKNTLDGERLLEFVNRIETIQEEIKGLKLDVTAVYNEAKAAGFSNKPIRSVIKARAMSQSDFQDQEDLRDLYLHAVGLAVDLPLFRHLDGLAGDKLGRGKLISGLEAMLPKGAAMTLQLGDTAIRIWRDDKGGHHEEYTPPAAKGKRAPNGAGPKLVK